MKFIGALFLLYGLIGVQQAQFCDTYLNVANDSNHVYKDSETVHFNCEILNTSSAGINKSTFYILHLGSQTKFPVTKITGNIGFANVKVVSKKLGGNYSCRYDNCTIDGLRTIFDVKIDNCSFPKQNSTKRPEIDCKINDLFNMTCEWSPLTDDGCTMWKAMYKSEVMDRYECCSADGSENCTSSSSRGHCDIPSMEFYRFIPFNITLREISELETNVYNYTVVTDDTIASVDIANDVRVKPGLDAYTLEVWFTLHHPPSSVGGMVCNVKYSSEWNPENAMKITFDSNQMDLDVNVSLDHLTPYTQYNVNISCKPLISQYWSNKVTGIGRTSPAVPFGAPKIVGYSYIRATPTFSEIHLFLYLEPLKKKLWYGDNTSYLIRVDDNETIYDQNIPAETVTLELYKPINRNKSYYISVRAENEAGFTTWSHLVIIEGFDRQDADQQELVVEESKSDVQLLLYLQYDRYGREESSSYYYCQGEPNSYPPICNTTLQRTKSRFKMQGNLRYYTSNWYFGTMLLEDDKRILWSSCVFSSEVRSARKQNRLDVAASASPGNDSVVKLRLLTDYCELKNRPLSYQVAFFEFKQNQNDVCGKVNISAYQNFSATPFVRELQVFVGRIADVLLCFRVQNSDNSVQSSRITVHFPRKNDIVHVARGKTDKNNTIIISVLCVIVVCVLVFVSIYLCKKRIQKLNEMNKVSNDIFTQDLLDSSEHMATQSGDSSSESSDSSGIYSISRSVSDGSDRDDQTNVKTLQINRERKTVAFENPQTDLMPPQLPLPMFPSNRASDSEDSYSISGTEEMHEQDKWQTQRPESYEMASREVTTELNVTTTNGRFLQENGQLRNGSQRATCVDNDDYAIPAIKANDEQQSDDHEIAGGLSIREIDCSSMDDGYLQDNGRQRNLSHLVTYRENDIHDGEINSFTDRSNQFEFSGSMSVGEYFMAVASQSYDSDTNSIDGYLTAHVNFNSSSTPATWQTFDSANIPQRQANAQVNYLNSGDLPHIGNDSSTTYSFDDYLITSSEETSVSGCTSVDEYCRAEAFETPIDSSTFTGLSSNQSEHLFNTVRPHMGISSSGSSDDSEFEPLEDYQRAVQSTRTNNIDGNPGNYMELNDLTIRVNEN